MTQCWLNIAFLWYDLVLSVLLKCLVITAAVVSVLHLECYINATHFKVGIKNLKCKEYKKEKAYGLQVVGLSLIHI